MTPSTKFAKFAPTIAYYLSSIIMGAITAASGPSLPTLAENTSSGLQRISLIFVFSSLGYLIGSYFGGRAYDRVSGHKLMTGILLTLGTVVALIPGVHTLGTLLLFFLLTGLANGALDAGCNTLLLWAHSKKAGPFMNGLHFFFGVGSFTAPLVLANVLQTTGDILWLYWSIAIICLPVALWFWFLPEPPAPTRTTGGKNASFPMLAVFFCVILFFLNVGLELGFGNWIYTYALTLGLGTTITAAYLTSAFWGSFTLGRLAAIWISARARSQTILVMDLIGCGVGILIIMIWKDSVPALWIGTIALGLSIASMFPTSMMLASERMTISGAITGWFLVGSGIGGMFLPWLIGQIFAHAGPGSMTTVLLIDSIAILFILLLFAGRRIIPPPKPALDTD
jgi:FHS family Na+ dependent glucose MFS transporter 1